MQILKFASHNAKPQREAVEYRLRWVPNAKFLRWAYTFCVILLFVFSVEYGLWDRYKSVGVRIREIPGHATFRGKGVNTGLVRQTWGLSLFGPM